MEQSRLEIRSTLVDARDTGDLVRIHRTVERGFAEGYVVDVGAEWFALSLVADLIIFNGFQVFRLREVSSVEVPAPHAGFVERVLRIRRQTRPPDPRIDLTDIATVLKTASASYPLITVHREVVDPEVCHIGSVARIADGMVALKLISADAEWLKEQESFLLPDITRVDFGGLYEEALRLAVLPG
jgi:hypothetical protein